MRFALKMRRVGTYPLHESRFLAKISNARAVEVGQDLVHEDCICYLRSVKQIHLKQASLKVRLLRLVVLERFEEEGRRRLDHVLRHEDIDDPLHVDQRTGLVLDQLCCKLGTLLGVHAHDVLKETNIIWGVTGLLRVQHDLLGLASLRKARDDLVRDVRAKVDRERKRHVERPNDVSQFLTAGELVLLQPLLKQLLATLLQDRTRKLQRLELVKLALLEQDTEVLQDRG